MTGALLCAKPRTLATSASLPPSLTPSESVESYVACDGLDPTEATAYALVLYATLHYVFHTALKQFRGRCEITVLSHRAV